MTPAISKTETTLADLAALAAKVEGFVRPFHKCARCNGRGEFFHDVLHEDVTCAKCDGAKGSFNNDAAALAMAVWVCVVKRDLTLAADGGSILVRRFYRMEYEDGNETAHEEPASIARALLVALLRAHGVEVPNE